MEEQIPIIDAIDHDILMHRDAHFAGLFSIMLDYYQKEGKGTQPEFDIQRIQRLAELETQLKQNLAPLYLTVEEAEKIGKARNAYEKLRAIYELNKTKNKIPQLIADLILSEDEEAENEIQALINDKEQSVPFLIELLRNEEFFDPLFPGYGKAPLLAGKCLALIGDKRALISLFEAIGQGDFFSDENILKGFLSIGIPARDFLLKVVKGFPLTEDNEKAAIALIAFKDDPQVSSDCLELLQKPEIQKDPCLSTYLVLICAGLSEKQQRNQFIELINSTNFPKLLKNDALAVVHEWKST